MSSEKINHLTALSLHYRNEQKRLKETLQKIKIQSEQYHQQIYKQLQKLKQASQVINQNATRLQNSYKQSLNGDNYCSEIVNLGSLSNYLKSQKKFLAEVVSNQQQSGAIKKPNTKNLLHKLSNRKKFQKILQQLEQYKLQKQIEYLQKYILIDSSKSNKVQNSILYDVQNVSIKEEKQLIQKISFSLEQLERVVMLSNQCGAHQNNELDVKKIKLIKQSQRLNRIQKILNNQTNQISKIKNFFRNYHPNQIQSTFSEAQTLLQIKQSAQNLQKNQNLSKSQIKFLFNLNFDQNYIKKFKKPFDQVYDALKMYKKQIKNMKI